MKLEEQVCSLELSKQLDKLGVKQKSLFYWFYNLNYNPDLKEYESNGFESGTFDDRWAFTNKSPFHNHASIGALSAASRALRGYNNELADECHHTFLTER